MKLLEKIIILLIAIIIICRIIDFVGSSILSGFFLPTIGLFYLLGSWYYLKDFKNKQQNLFLSVISGFIYSYAILGILYKIQYWNNGNNILMYSCTINFIYLIVLVSVIIKNKNRYKMLLLYRLIYIILLQIIVFLIF